MFRNSHQFLAFALLLSLSISPGCSKDPDRQAIEDLIQNLKTSCETKNFENAVSLLTDDYTDNFKQDPQKVLSRLQRIFKSYDRLEVNLGVGEIKIQGRTATTDLKIKVNAFKGERKIPLFGAPIISRRVQLDLQKRQTDWKIVLAHIHRGGGIF